MNLTSQNVTATFLNCLFLKGESTDNYVLAKGVKLMVGFHPERLKQATVKSSNKFWHYII